jgi:hypothetical protein
VASEWVPPWARTVLIRNAPPAFGCVALGASVVQPWGAVSSKVHCVGTQADPSMHASVPAPQRKPHTPSSHAGVPLGALAQATQFGPQCSTSEFA